VEEICKYIGADSLAYLSVEGMLSAVSKNGDQCTACFTGDYPTAVPEHFEKEQFSAQKTEMKCKQ
jgi:amidophosphoribosyltransferase